MEATGTAGNLSSHALKGTAEPAVMVATRCNLRVESTEPEFLWACAGGAAETAAEVTDELPSVFCKGAGGSLIAAFWRVVGAAGWLGPLLG